MSKNSFKIHKIIKNSSAEGPGNRLVFWVQGCSIRCDGCFEKEAWDFKAGYEVQINDLLKMLDEPYLEGVTILGGEPFDQAEALATFLEHVKAIGKNSIVFSGYEYEYLCKINDVSINKSLDNIDVLIDGKYIKNMPEMSRPLIGSSNQRFIGLSDEGRKLIKLLDLYINKVEIRISPNGSVMINGMWKKED